MKEAAVVLFARAPARGRVKTRLAAMAGVAAATRAYSALLGLALARAASWPGPRAIACADEDSRRYFAGLPQAAGFSCFEQEGADLGARMRAALRWGLAQAPGAILIGTDVADHAPGDLFSARAALAKSDVVLGPVADGGYWLIAVHEDRPALFADVPWSTPRVFSRTLQHARGLSVQVLPMRRDVDDAAALAACPLPWALAVPEA